MKQKTNKMLIFTSLAAYFTYFIHGIGASILGQYKPEFAAAWGAKPLADGTLDVSMVVSVIAALGLGRLISQLSVEMCDLFLFYVIGSFVLRFLDFLFFLGRL